MTAKHKPTAKTRKQTQEMAGYGLPHEQIGGIIGIDDKTLRQHYKAELMKGKASASLAVAKSLFQKATEDRDMDRSYQKTNSLMVICLFSGVTKKASLPRIVSRYEPSAGGCPYGAVFASKLADYILQCFYNCTL